MTSFLVPVLATMLTSSLCMNIMLWNEYRSMENFLNNQYRNFID